jgi:hypothetical protein
MREYPGGQPQQADGTVQSLDLRTANLTQELSQLLAQTIAQSQTGKHTAGAAATGAQFSNLVALVSTATQTQRGHQPSFRDGLSSLSYSRPAQPVAPPPVSPVLAPPAPGLIAVSPAGLMPPAANGLLVSDPHDEEPMPIPSTWRQPTHGDDDRWYRQQLGAAGLGLLAGLVVVVPAVLWLSGFLGGAPSKAARQAAAETPAVKVAEVKPVKVASATTSVEPRMAVVPPAAPVKVVVPPAAPVKPVVPPPVQPRAVVVEPPPAAVAVAPVPRPVEPVRSRAQELLAQAKRRIESGDIAGARDILQAPETAKSAEMTFLLAETYDPNMLASWQTRGVTANPQRARALYRKASELGDSMARARAKQRLDWLTAN